MGRTYLGERSKSRAVVQLESMADAKVAFRKHDMVNDMRASRQFVELRKLAAIAMHSSLGTRRTHRWRRFRLFQNLSHF